MVRTIIGWLVGVLLGFFMGLMLGVVLAIGWVPQRPGQPLDNVNAMANAVFLSVIACTLGGGVLGAVTGFILARPGPRDRGPERPGLS
jgi:hypothetical protein